MQLAGTLLLPSEAASVATAILLPGSGHHDRNETIGTFKPFAVIADHLANRGVASLRLDGRGVGLSGGSTQNVDFDSKVQDALAARRWLVEHASMDESRLVFIGHSEGGLVGAAASTKRPTALAMLAGPAEPIKATLHFMAEAQSRAAGATQSQIAHETAMNEAAFALAAAQLEEAGREALIDLIASYLASWPDTESPLSEVDRLSTATAMADTLFASDFRSLLQQQPEDYLCRLTLPVLAMFGERDRQVTPGPNLAAFLHATASHPSARALVLPEHNHLFQVAITGEIEEYKTLGVSPSSVALEALAEWINDIFRRQ